MLSSLLTVLSHCSDVALSTSLVDSSDPQRGVGDLSRSSPSSTSAVRGVLVLLNIAMGLGSSSKECLVLTSKTHSSTRNSP
jgi:hypothetical protein